MNIDEIKMLTKAEQDMDSGKAFFVVIEGVSRCPVSSEIVEQIGLKQGQTVSQHLWIEILQLTMDNLTAKIAGENALKDGKESYDDEK